MAVEMVGSFRDAFENQLTRLNRKQGKLIVYSRCTCVLISELQGVLLTPISTVRLSAKHEKDGPNWSLLLAPIVPSIVA
jgi:hypothetical protein